MALRIVPQTDQGRSFDCPPGLGAIKDIYQPLSGQRSSVLRFLVMVRTKLQRRRRTAARISLYTSFVLVGALALALYPILKRPIRVGLSMAWSKVDYRALPEVLRLQELVRIDTTRETGDEAQAARFLASELEAAGIAAHVEIVGPGKANLYAILEGEDPQALVLHNHLDVDPVPNPEAWDYPPFGGTIRLPWIFGRGVFDMKSVTIAQLEAILALKKRNRPPRRSVIFLATSSEEIGSDLGVRWVLRQHPELVSRFWAVLTEGGVLEATARTEIKYWGTGFAQKRFVNVTACAAERHRLEELLRDIRVRGQPLTGLQLTPPVETFLKSYASTRTNPQYRRYLSNPETLTRRLHAFRKLPAYVQAMFRNEVHPFPVQEDPEQGGYSMRIILHLLPGVDLETAFAELLPDWMTMGVSFAIEDPTPRATESPVDHPAFQTITRALEERYPGVVSGPHYLPFSATDARFFRQAGVPAYGFTPFLLMSTDSLTISQVNEQLAVPAYVEGVELYVDVVERIVGYGELGEAEIQGKSVTVPD